jgi:hypothetical protein
MRLAHGVRRSHTLDLDMTKVQDGTCMVSGWGPALRLRTTTEVSRTPWHLVNEWKWKWFRCCEKRCTFLVGEFWRRERRSPMPGTGHRLPRQLRDASCGPYPFPLVVNNRLSSRLHNASASNRRTSLLHVRSPRSPPCPTGVSVSPTFGQPHIDLKRSNQSAGYRWNLMSSPGSDSLRDTVRGYRHKGKNTTEAHYPRQLSKASLRGVLSMAYAHSGQEKLFPVNLYLPLTSTQWQLSGGR